MYYLQKFRCKRFITKTCMIVFFCITAVFVIFHLRSITNFSDAHVQIRFFLQKQQYMLSDHTNLNKEDMDQYLLIDKTSFLSEDKLIEEIQHEFPTIYWNKYKSDSMRVNKTCARFPNIFILEFNNIYWQTLKTKNGTFQLFGAYLDNRAKNILGPTVRLLGMMDRIEPTVLTFCQIWFEGSKKPVIVKSLKYKYIWDKQWGNYKQGIYQPYLISCVLPKIYKEKIPASVSLVEHPCENSTNNLRVIYQKPKKKKNFAVCVKGLDFLYTDLSVRLIEWIELLNILGVDKIFFYKLQIHPNVAKVLKYYEQEGKIHVTPISLPGGQPNAPALQHLYLTKNINSKRQNELIPYNDCFYKHMYEYEYITPLDIDEVIMPKNVTSWSELISIVLRKSNKKPRTNYNVRQVYFLDDFLHVHGWFKEIPKYMHMLQHTYRAKNSSANGSYLKSFLDTEKILTVFNHYPLSCLGGCKSYTVEIVDAQLHHYRTDCHNAQECRSLKETTVMDTTLWKYKDDLIKRVANTMKLLGYFRI